ncbi:hypothetical protein ACLOJK_016587 [Asimina triloba]
MIMEEERWGEAIMGALISLDIPHFSHLTHSLALDSIRSQRRLCFLLSSPHHFSHTLHYIESLSFQHKALLLARFLLRSLRHITLSSSPAAPTAAAKNLGMENSLDHDAGLLLFALCDSSDLDCVDWRASLTNRFLEKTLSLGGLGVSPWAVLAPSVDTAVNCRRFLEAVTGTSEMVGSVTWVKEYDGNGIGKECVICWELMERSKWDGCELPCGHVFHWSCVLPWLRKANTCPCCRFELPTSASGNGVFCEIERLWSLVIARSTRNECSGYWG